MKAYQGIMEGMKAYQGIMEEYESLPRYNGGVGVHYLGIMEGYESLPRYHGGELVFTKVL